MQFPVTGVLAQADGWLGVLFFVIAGIGWVINLVNQSKTPGKGNARQPNRPVNRQKRDQVQSEIDKFLQQTRQRPQGAGGKPAQEKQVATGNIEVVVPGNKQARRSPQRAKSRREIWEEQVGQRGASAATPPAARQPQKTTPPASRRGDREEKNAGRSGKSPAGSRLAETVARDMAPTVDALVNTHLGAFGAGDDNAPGQQAIGETRQKRATPAAALLSLLKSRRGIRDAILVNEVLSKPLSLRRRG